MTIMLSGIDVNQTKTLLEHVLATCLPKGERVMFLTSPSDGPLIVQRLRVKLSRTRGSILNKGKRVKKFALNSSIHSHTDLSGKRHDCVVMWTSRSLTHEMDEILEDMLQKDVN